MILFLPILVVFFITGKIIFFYIACLMLIPVVTGGLLSEAFAGVSGVFEGAGETVQYILGAIGVGVILFMMI
jgi:hypothetical protein